MWLCSILRSKQSVVRTASAVNEQLKKAQSLLSVEVNHSKETLEALEATGDTLNRTSVEYDKHGAATSAGQRAVRKIEARDRTELYITVAGALIFFLTVLYVLDSRVGLFVPMRFVYEILFAGDELEDVVHTAGPVLASREL